MKVRMLLIVLLSLSIVVLSGKLHAGVFENLNYFDSNNTADILLRKSDNQYWHLFLMNGATVTPNYNISLPTSSNLELVSIADFNGNGKADMLFRNMNNGYWHLFLMNGATATPNYKVSLPTSLNLKVVGIADFDGNNTADVLLRNIDNGYWHLFQMNGATVTPNYNISLPTSSNLELVSIADFNGNGKADMLFRNMNNGYWHLFLMNGATVTPNYKVSLPTSLNLKVVGIADFDGNNTADVLLRNMDNGYWHLFQMNGATVTPNYNISLPTSSILKLAGIADFDGNNKSDVLLRNEDNGYWHLFLMNGATVTPHYKISLPTNLYLHVEGIADFNGNGTADVLLRNLLDDNSYWHLFLMNGAAVTPNYKISLPTDYKVRNPLIDIVAYTRKMIVGAWAYDGSASGCAIDPNVEVELDGSFICPSGDFKANEWWYEAPNWFQGFANGTYYVSNEIGLDIASIVLDYETTFCDTQFCYPFEGPLARQEGDMLYRSDDWAWGDYISYKYNGCWHWLYRFIGTPEEINFEENCVYDGQGDQCSLNSDCGRCFYCDTGGSTNVCKYGGEGPYGCYRGWEPYYY
ncbi:FG-GAP repeat domain-containing protein [Thermodesulfobacteriota bacterium]